MENEKSEEEEKREEKIQAFKAEYLELVKKHELDFMAQMSYKENGSFPVMVIIDVVKKEETK